MFFLRRRRTGPDRFLPLKVALLVVGGLLGLVGMRVENSLLVSIAIGVVLAGFLLRFMRQPAAEDREPGATVQPPDSRSPDRDPR